MHSVSSRVQKALQRHSQTLRDSNIMKKWSVTSATPATCNRRGEGSPGTAQHSAGPPPAVCTGNHVCISLCSRGRGAQRSAGPPPACRLTCSNDKGPVEQERQAQGSWVPLGHCSSFSLELTGTSFSYPGRVDLLDISGA